MKKKRIVATAYIDVPHGTPYDAGRLAAEIKCQAADVVEADISDRCHLSCKSGLARRVGKLHVRGGFSLPHSGRDPKTLTLEDLIKRASAESPDSVVRRNPLQEVQHDRARKALEWLIAQRDSAA